MRKNMKRICTGLLAMTMLLTSCGNSDTTGSSGATEAKNPVKTQELHYLENTLHKVNVKESDRPFVVNGETEYRVIAAADDASQKAADYLIKYVAKATGCYMEKAPAEAFTLDGKFIVLNEKDLFKEASLTMPKEDLGIVGYYVKSQSDNVFLMSNYDQGIRFAMLSFLDHVVGIEIYSMDVIAYEKDGSTLPDMNIIEKPDLNYMHFNNRSGGNEELKYMMGFMDSSAFLKLEGGSTWHNSLDYLPMETYRAAHPDWYSTEDNDLCFTAHGNQAELEAMTAEIARIMLENLEKNPQASIAAVTIMDHRVACTCKACTESKTKYNGSNAAAAVKFTNMINEIVQSELQKQADAAGTTKRPLTIIFFAYHAFNMPPVKTNADGTYTPIDDSVICDEGTAVFFAPIEAQYNKTFYHENNSEFNKMTKGWAACSSELYCWLYETGFYHYMYPYDSWNASLETYRFLIENGATYIMPQGQYNVTGHTGFTRLKDYINSKASVNMNQDYPKLVENFFDNYYGSAAEPMKQYFEELQGWMDKLEADYPSEYTGTIYISLNEEKWWPKNMLLRWLDMIDQAYEAIEPYKKTDVKKYEMLEEHIKLESIFLRFALIEHHSGYYSPEQLKEMKISFKQDCEELGFTHEQERSVIKTIFDNWEM